MFAIFCLLQGKEEDIEAYSSNLEGIRNRYNGLKAEKESLKQDLETTQCQLNEAMQERFSIEVRM